MMYFKPRWQRRFSYLLRALPLGALCGFLACPADSRAQDVVSEKQTNATLVTAAAVRKLSGSEAERGLPVRLSAVVTFYDAQTDLLVVQDRTGGVFVQQPHGTNLARGTNLDLRVGQAIDVEGVTRPGDFAPVVAEAILRVQGKGRMPTPRPLTAENLFAGTEAGNWVEVHGIVTATSVSTQQQWLDLDVAVLGESFKAHIPGISKTNLVDSQVRFYGVAGTFFQKRRRTLGLELFVPSLEYIKVERPAPKDPFALSACPINRLMQWDTNASPGHRVKVQGTVTLKWDEKQIYMQDGSGGIYVELTKPLTVEPGTVIEVVGFPKANSYSTKLRQAVWRKRGNAPPVLPTPTTARKLRLGELDGILVQLDATLSGQVQHRNTRVLTFHEGDWSFEAHLRSNKVTQALAALQPGSQVSVTGVCEVTASDRQRPNVVRVLLRSPEDLTLLAQPPWWTVQRLLTVLVFVILGAALSLLLYSRRVSALQRKYRQLFENASDLVCTLDLDGRFTSVNQAAEKITGYAKAEACGRSFEDWTAPDQRTSFRAWWSHLLTGQPTPPTEFSIVTRDGQPIVLEVSGRVLRHRGKPIAVEAIARDITVRKQAIEQQLKLERKMLEAQKLESLGVMAGGIAHDFNNLLTVILGNARMAASAAPGDSLQRSHLGCIERTSRQAADLCKQLLAYSGKGHCVIQRIDINGVIEDMSQLLQMSISKKAVLEMDLAERLPAIECDPSQFRQVLMNLAINASEALGDKNGSIYIRTGAEQADGIQQAVVSFATDLPPGDYVFVEVADTGCGMDRETLSKIFDPFFTTKFVGRGLGLAAVSGIVRAHRGALRITSEPGRGTVFRILFPSCRAPADPRPGPSAPAPRWEGHGTVLLADDEPAVRAVTAQMLMWMGFDVISAADGEEAIATFRDHVDEIVAVVLDLTMPHLSGENTLREVRRLRPGVPVLLMSGFSETEAMNKFCGQAASSFLAKPFQPEELREKMQAILTMDDRQDSDPDLVTSGSELSIRKSGAV